VVGYIPTQKLTYNEILKNTDVVVIGTMLAGPNISSNRVSYLRKVKVNRILASVWNMTDLTNKIINISSTTNILWLAVRYEDGKRPVPLSEVILFLKKYKVDDYILDNYNIPKSSTFVMVDGKNTQFMLNYYKFSSGKHYGSKRMKEQQSALKSVFNTSNITHAPDCINYTLSMMWTANTNIQVDTSRANYQIATNVAHKCGKRFKLYDYDFQIKK